MMFCYNDGLIFGIGSDFIILDDVYKSKIFYVYIGMFYSVFKG